MPDDVWHFEMLGGLTARFGAGPDAPAARPATRRAAALMAYLALWPGERRSREALAAMFWPDVDPASARGSLRQALAALRRVLEGEGLAPEGGVIVAEGNSSLWFAPEAVTSDVAAFRAALARAAARRKAGDTTGEAAALEEAVALYRGPLLPDVGEYDWLRQERDTLAAEYERAVAGLRRETPEAEAAPAPPPAAPPPAAKPPLRLPLTLSRFFGREGEIAAVTALLAAPDVRLVTLTGPGGSGKTRLAVEAARAVADEFPGGVTFVPLADLREAARLPDAVAAALELPRASHVPAIERAAEALNAAGAGRALLIFDNLEQLLPDAVDPLLDLLGRAPGLSCLVTSRQTLLAEGEREVHVGPLPVPGAGKDPADAADRLLGSASVALFVNRAQASLPDFRLTPRNAADVAALVARLEGVPLAIELAAGWVQALPPAQMLRRMEERGAFDLLVSRSRRPGGGPAAARHAALRAAIEWSYDLLGADTRRLFAALSVFRGGWTLTAAEAVCGGAALEGLARLREHSLVVPDEEAPDGAGPRYRMLESLREYAAERLGDGAERAALAAAHAAHFAGFVEGVAARLRTAERPALLRALDAEHENVRAALAWCAGAGGDAATGLRLAGAAWRYWSARFHHTEGRAVLAAALAAPGADVPELASARAQALVGAATLAREQGDHAAASALADEALGIWRALGDPLQEAVTLGVRGAAVATASDYAGAETAYDAAERLLRALPADPARDAALSSLLNNAGAMAMERGDFPRARTLLTEGLSLARTSGDAESECRALYNLGATLTSLDDETDDAAHQSLLAEAEGHFDACLARAHEMEDGRMVAFALYGVGDIYFMRNETGRAEAAYAESAALFQRGGDRRLQAAVLRSQVYLALHHGDAARAARPAAEAIRVLLLQGDRRQLASALDLAACVPAMAGRHAEAARLWGAAEAIRTALGVRTRSVPDSPNAVQSAAARTALGDAAYDAAFAEGEAMPAEDAAALALSLLGA